MERIRCEADLAAGTAALIAAEPRFGEAVEAAGPPPLRLRPGGFAALMKLIVEQQVSVASGNAIWARIEAAGATTPEAVLARDPDALRALGLSRPKAAYARALSEAVLAGEVCFVRQAALPYDEAAAELVAVKGIGRWTAELYHLACEGRADLLPVGDIALQEAARALFGLPERPSAKAFEALGAPWSPWRSVAARILWSYYRVLKGREGKA
ncbi:MAG: DNA-3-methyladenine glycosylase 2 family protein [Pseudomonadota bacterium]